MQWFRKKMKPKVQNEKIYSVIILAAGKSSRMGTPKWSLHFDKNTSFIEHIISEYYSFGCKDIILVINETDYPSFVQKNYSTFENFKLVINNHPEWDRFYSLKCGIQKLENTPFVFIHNVDNPFVNQDVLQELINKSELADYISPQFEGKGGHPILLNERIINDIRNMPLNEMHFKEFLGRYTNHKVKVADKHILTNINSLEEYSLYFT